jgi:hypothetical protein
MVPLLSNPIGSTKTCLLPRLDASFENFHIPIAFLNINGRLTGSACLIGSASVEDDPLIFRKG